MKSIAVLLALVGAASNATVAAAQTAERLSRPVQTSSVGSDGRLSVSGDATLGNMIVEQYALIGQKIFASGARSEVVVDALKPQMCAPRGAGGFSADQVKRAVASMSPAERASLKARDAASLTGLAVKLVAAFDGVSADAIQADEAIGPGVYHNAIDGFRVALDVCRFFGEERRL